MLADRIGTVAFVTDYSGAVVEDQTHYPWGKTWADQGGIEERFARMQHRDEETDLDPTHYRMYSSDQGRWQSPDPVRPCVHHPQEFDRYQYAANNPTNRTDPGGACTSQADCQADFASCTSEFGDLVSTCVDGCVARYYYCLYTGGSGLGCTIEESACLGACGGLSRLVEYYCEGSYRSCLADLCPTPPAPVRPRPPRPILR